MDHNEFESRNSAAFARLFWMGLGPAILSVLVVFIVTSTTGWFTLSNLVFLAVLAGMLFARWREFQAGNPTTGTGEPATQADLHWYILLTTVIGLCVGLGANLVRTYWRAG